MKNNLAGSRTNKIKALEIEMEKNLAGSSIQTAFVFEVEIEKEINGIQMRLKKYGDYYGA
jgi:hypothetical protein